jgi:hypothetical protein
MEKLGKKALKILKTKQYDELDTGDIAIALQCDDDSVEVSLNALKDKKLIESYSRSGKVYWRLFADEPIKNPIDSEIFELEVALEKKNNPESDEFIIDALQKEPVKAFAKLKTAEPAIKPAEKSDTATEEFIIDALQKEPVTASAQPKTAEPTITPEKKNNPEPEEFIINRIPSPAEPDKSLYAGIIYAERYNSATETKETVQELAKPIVPELIIEPEENSKKQPETVILQEASIDPIDGIDDESLVDDNTRVWTLPLVKPIDSEETVHNQKPPEEIPEQTETTTPLKRANFSMVGIIIAILLSVSISTGITMFVSMSAINIATSDLQTLKTLVIETNAKHDRQIELLIKKLNFLEEKTELLQKQKSK